MASRYATSTRTCISSRELGSACCFSTLGASSRLSAPVRISSASLSVHPEKGMWELLHWMYMGPRNVYVRMGGGHCFAKVVWQRDTRNGTSGQPVLMLKQKGSTVELVTHIEGSAGRQRRVASMRAHERRWYVIASLVQPSRLLGGAPRGSQASLRETLACTLSRHA